MPTLAYVLILLFQSSGGNGIQTAALSQYRYGNQKSCQNALIAASKLNANVKGVCVPQSAI